MNVIDKNWNFDFKNKTKYQGYTENTFIPEETSKFEKLRRIKNQIKHLLISFIFTFLYFILIYRFNSDKS